MVVSDIIEKTTDTVVVRAPAYNKTGIEYGGQTVEIGEYNQSTLPPYDVANANVQSVSNGRFGTLVVVADI